MKVEEARIVHPVRSLHPARCKIYNRTSQRQNTQPLLRKSGISSNGVHQPVLKDEVIKNLKIRKEGIYLDATLGGGGHAEGILKKLGPRGGLIGIDWDKEAIREARHKLSAFKKKIIFIRENYKALPEILKQLKIDKLDGILLDLGVSSLQLESRRRGFSFRFSAPLDMRMDERGKLTADTLINKLSENDLRKIFFLFGEERFSKRIARAIISSRLKKPIRTTQELVQIIEGALPLQEHFRPIHPATRVFQALRIAVNLELDNLKCFLKESIDFLKRGGRLAIISYHSLEDRIVKNFFKDLARTCICPPDFPVCRCGVIPQLKIITPKPIRPKEEELKKNPRARSARLRLAEKL